MKAALILAAGFGTRLRPYTEYMPKPLLPVAGIEPLFFALWRAKCLGAQVFYVNAHYHHAQIASFLKMVVEPVLGIRTELLVEDPILGTGGAIRNLLGKTSAQSFSELLVINGDTLLGVEAPQEMNAVKESWCLVSDDQNFLKKYKPMWVDRGGLYAGVGELEDPAAGWSPTHFLGLHVLKLAALKILRTKQNAVVEEDLFRGIYRPLIDDGLKLVALTHNLGSSEFWFDMTNKEFLLEAQRHLIASISDECGIWRQALEARWQHSAQRVGGAWLIGQDPGCVNWSRSHDSIVVSPAGVRPQGDLGLESSVLILDDVTPALGSGFARNSLLMSTRTPSKPQSRVGLNDEIIFL